MPSDPGSLGLQKVLHPEAEELGPSLIMWLWANPFSLSLSFPPYELKTRKKGSAGRPLSFRKGAVSSNILASYSSSQARLCPHLYTQEAKASGGIWHPLGPGRFLQWR